MPIPPRPVEPTVEARPASTNVRFASVQTLRQCIADFQGRIPNWDGDDGIAPRFEAVQDALAFLHGLAKAVPVPGAVFAPGDGEVMFQWRTSTAFVEVGFRGDGLLSWGAERDGATCGFGDEPFTRSSPGAHPQLMSILEALDASNAVSGS